MYLKNHNAILNQVLPLPLLLSDSTKILVGPLSPLRTPGKVPAQGVVIECEDTEPNKWAKLEEMVVTEAQGSLPMIFKPMITLFTKKNTVNNPICIVGEPIQAAVFLQNPLEIPLVLKDIYLLWQYKDKNNRFAANEIMGNDIDHMKTNLVQSVTLCPTSTQEVILSITPLSVGEVVLKGICYHLCCASSDLTVKGKQVFAENDSKENKRLEITIVPTAPCLQVYFAEIHTDVIRNQIQQITIELRNVSTIGIKKIYLGTAVPEILSTSAFHTKKFTIPDNLPPAVREKEARKNHVSCVNLPNGRLEPGQCHTVSLWLKTPDQGDNINADLLIYYESVNEGSPSYRLIRHNWNLNVQDSIKLDCVTNRSSNSKHSEQVTFALKVQNLNRAHSQTKIEVSLLNIGLISKNWTLIPDLIAAKHLSIKFEESEYVFLKAMRRKDSRTDYSEASFAGGTLEEFSRNAYLDFGRQENETRINIFTSVFDENCVLINNNSCSNNEGVIMVRWKAAVIDNHHRRTAFGQNLSIVKSLNETATVVDVKESLFPLKEAIEVKLSSESIENGIDAKKKLIKCSMVHPVTIEHNFNNNKLCIVPIRLLLHSISDAKLIVTINALDTSR